MTDKYLEQKINNRKAIRRRRKRRIYYNTKFTWPLFTFVLIFCLLQIGYGAVLNVGKIVSYQGKQATLEDLLQKAQMRNKDLKAQKKVITSDNSLEGIARNNLKMASQDEVLIIINKKVEEPKPKKRKWNFGKWFKKDKHEEVKPENIYIPPEVVEE